MAPCSGAALLFFSSLSLFLLTLFVRRPAPRASVAFIPPQSDDRSRQLGAARREWRRRRTNLHLASSLHNASSAAIPVISASLESTAAKLAEISASPPPPPSPVVADQTCHAKEHAGYAGDGAVVWGMSFHVSDAAECCRACRAHHDACSVPGSEGKRWWPARPEMRCGAHVERACRIWTFCPEQRCFAFDIHVHTFGECWLKFQADDPTRPRDPHFETGTTGRASYYPEAMRKAPRRMWPWAVKEEVWPGPMPERVPWTSGVLAPAETAIVSSPPQDKWREKWCRKHGPCL